jgi:hypothetical protein
MVKAIARAFRSRDMLEDGEEAAITNCEDQRNLRRSPAAADAEAPGDPQRTAYSGLQMDSLLKRFSVV